LAFAASTSNEVKELHWEKALELMYVTSPGIEIDLNEEHELNE
jgi:hypothetical protein